MFKEDISSLQQKLASGNLPGFKSHVKLSPASRRFFPGKDKEKPHDSAVLILFYPKNNISHIAFIVRPVDNSVHSGQVALPGGRTEPYDESIIDTALREAWEEIGVHKQDVKVIGKLSQIYIPPSNFMVYPVVGAINYNPEFVCNEDEVEHLLEIEWNKLKAPSTRTHTIVTTRNGDISVPCYCIDKNIIWGATSMIISELIDTAQ